MSKLTEKAIKDSLIKLLNEKPLNKITVKDIVDDCGLNRNSFYYHFKDIPSLLQSIITEEADIIIAEYSTIDSIETCIQVAVKFALENKKAVLNMYHSINRDIYEQYLWRVCRYVVPKYIGTLIENQPVKDADIEVITKYYECVCFGIVNAWMESNMDDDLVDSLKRLLELKKGLVEQMIERSVGF